MFRSLLVTAAMFSATLCTATELPVASLSGSCNSSIDAASEEAIKKALSNSSRYEYGGAVLSFEGKYCYTEPVSENDPENVSFSLNVPAGYKLVALYHTHPFAPDENAACEGFSAADLEVSKALKTRSYIGFVGSKAIRYYDPNESGPDFKAVRCSSGKKVKGRLVASLIG